MQSLNFLQLVNSNGQILKSDLNKYTSNNLEGCVPQVDLECLKELRELHNDFPLTSDKIEIKREMLSEYQLKIADLQNIPIGNVKKLLPNFSDKESYQLHYENWQLYFRLLNSTYKKEQKQKKIMTKMEKRSTN